MPAGFVVTHAFKQNITGGAFESLAAATGDVLSVANYRDGSRAWIVEAWGANSANAADFGLRSPRFHDNSRGLRMAYDFAPTVAGTQDRVQLLLGRYVRQPVYSSDTIIAEVNATATNNVGLGWLTYYEDLPGLSQNLATWAEVQARMVNVLGVKVSVTAGAAGDYGATRLLNQDDDRLKADTYYAVLGATAQLQACTLILRGPDTSNFSIGLPLLVDESESAGWFADLSVKYNLPAIPIINANNRGNTLFQAAAPAGAVATAATIILAELR
jgi:hypothetical protein